MSVRTRMKSSRVWLASCAVSFAACAAVEDGPPTRWLVPPRVDPTRVRFETIVFEMPLERAEAHYRQADPTASTVGVSVDEHESRRELSELAAHASDVLRSDRPEAEVAPGNGVQIPVRAASSESPAGARAGDALDLTVIPTLSYGFAPFELDLSFVWWDARGRRLGQFKGRTPVPADHWMRIVCLPSKERGQASAEDPVPAIIAFLRLVPVYETVEMGRLEAHEGLSTEHGALENVGADAIEYTITGERRIASVDLGPRGRARWTGDGASLSIDGGAASRLRCIGDANRLRVVAGAALEPRSIELVGRDNRCEVELSH